ncbi:MAG: ATP phosphoribosyltransferase regulatory subunit [Calditrichaeota bacterium]|nr:MAG: ATP phosphoribosyltransferase regulatory subunit [Calditrichota bacterium]
MIDQTTKNPLRLPAGIKDFIFDEAKEHRFVERALIDLLIENGYGEIITPTFEHGEIFEIATKAGMIRNGLDEKVYRFLDRDGNLLALRADFTAQIARIAASRFKGLTKELKIFYTGKVFRAEPHHEGRSREKWQVGFEILNKSSIAADAEAVIHILEALDKFKLKNVRVAIGHIGYFHGLIKESGLAGDKMKALKYLVERKDSAGIERFLDETAIDDEVKNVLLALPDLHGDITVLQKAKACAGHEKSMQALLKLDKLWDEISGHPLSKNVFFDLSEVEGMGYYTGIMIKAFTEGVGSEVGSGGRYDQLTAVFGAEMPAIGFSFDVDLVGKAIKIQKEK